ncbi:7655_t:CDS:1, partial [Funneliformis geosporum]
DNEQYEGRSAYKDAEEQIKNLKKEVAQDNLAEYRDKIVSDLPTKLKKNRLTEKELDPETKTEIEALKKETDPAKLVEREVKITQKIGQQSAAKKIVSFKKEVESFLKSNNSTEIEELKQQLTEFIKSDNVYYQTKKEEARQLLKQLERGLNLNNSRSSEPLPFSVQIGIGMGAVLIVLSFILIIHRKKQINFVRRRHLHLTKN